MKTHKNTIFLFSMLFSIVVAGCATTDQKLSRQQYQPVVSATGGSGELYLAVTDEPIVLRSDGKPTMRKKETGEKPVVRKPGVRKGAARKLAVVTVKDGRGKKLGVMVTPIAPDELLQDAFRQELNAAGYTVRLVNALPKGGGKGIAFSHVSMKMEQVSGLLAVEGTCKVNVGLDLRRNGVTVKKLRYEASYSDSAISDRDLLLQATMQKALQDVMKQAIPDIINALGH